MLTQERNHRMGRKDLIDVEDSNLGLKGSPTQIARASDKVRKGAGEQVNLDPLLQIIMLAKLGSKTRNLKNQRKEW